VGISLNNVLNVLCTDISDYPLSKTTFPRIIYEQIQAGNFSLAELNFQLTGKFIFIIRRRRRRRDG